MIWWSPCLNLHQFCSASSIPFVALNLVVNVLRSFSMASLFILAYSRTFLGFFLLTIALAVISTETAEWSLMPGITEVFFTRSGHDVKTKSSIFFCLVGSLTICVMNMLFIISTASWFTSLPYCAGVFMVLDCQLTLGRLKSPARMRCGRSWVLMMCSRFSFRACMSEVSAFVCR